jgi:hypothetical protein
MNESKKRSGWWSLAASLWAAAATCAVLYQAHAAASLAEAEPTPDAGGTSPAPTYDGAQETAELEQELASLQARIARLTSRLDGATSEEPEAGEAADAAPEDVESDPPAPDSEPSEDDQRAQLLGRLDDAMSAEGSDPEWSPRAEAELQAHLENQGKGDALLDVSCSARMCRIELETASDEVVDTLMQGGDGSLLDNGSVIMVDHESGLTYAFAPREPGGLPH